MASAAELDRIIAEMKVEIPLQPGSETKSFQTYLDLKNYFDGERSFWQSAGISEVASGFDQVSILLSQAQQYEGQIAQSKIQEALNFARSRQPSLIHSNTLQGEFLKYLSSKDRKAAEAASSIFVPGYEQSRIYGQVSALLLIHPEIRSGPESAELEAFRKQREKIDAFRNDIEANLQQLKANADNWQASNEQRTADLANKHATEHETQTKAFGDEHQNQMAAFAEWLKPAQQKVSDLETLYREKLRLEKPAEYWNQLEAKYVRQGLGGTIATLALVVGIAGWVTHFVYTPPAILQAPEFTLQGVRGALLIAAGISALLYMTNLLMKLTTSSFHLARDARERYQLTHVYLALKQEGAIEEKEREIILAALFSRSDTGLLKGDSGPSFPPTPITSIVEHMRPK